MNTVINDQATTCLWNRNITETEMCSFPKKALCAVQCKHAWGLLLLENTLGDSHSSFPLSHTAHGMKPPLCLGSVGFEEMLWYTRERKKTGCCPISRHLEEELRNWYLFPCAEKQPFYQRQTIAHTQTPTWSKSKIHTTKNNVSVN